jgi:hypothetical protein
MFNLDRFRDAQDAPQGGFAAALQSYGPVGRPATGSGTSSLSSPVWDNRPLLSITASPDQRRPLTIFAIACSASG